MLKFITKHYYYALVEFKVGKKCIRRMKGIQFTLGMLQREKQPGHLVPKHYISLECVAILFLCVYTQCAQYMFDEDYISYL